MAKAWFPFYLNDYLADTPLLSLAEHGAFCLLMMFYWNSDASAPASADRLHKICRCTTDAERDAVDHVVQEYFSAVDGKLVNSRLDKELAKSVSISASRSRAAKAKHAKASTSAPASAEQVYTQSQPQSQSQEKPINLCERDFIISQHKRIFARAISPAEFGKFGYLMQFPEDKVEKAFSAAKGKKSLNYVISILENDKPDKPKKGRLRK